MTEEVREALMRLAVCVRGKCGTCKYKDECTPKKVLEEGISKEILMYYLTKEQV